MAVQAIMAGANMALAAAPLFFGENNIFSGKARQATRELGRSFNRSQAMGIPQELESVAQQRQMRANQGLGSAAMGLYQQEAQRGQATALAGLGGRRSALAGIGSIAQSGQDAALRMAGMDEQARQQNRMLSEQTQMQVGQAKYENELRKQQEAADYWGTRKTESNAAISSALSAVGQAAGTALGTGAFAKTPTMPTMPQKGNFANYGFTPPKINTVTPPGLSSSMFPRTQVTENLPSGLIRGLRRSMVD